MKKIEAILVIVVGDSSIQVHALDAKGQRICTEVQAFPVQKNRPDGWQESSPLEIIYTLRAALTHLLQSQKISQFCALAISQAPLTTCLTWDKDTGLPLSPIVMSDRHPFTSALHQIPSSKKQLIGSIETWIVYNLTGRNMHTTDYSCALKTGLLDLETGYWNLNLLKEREIPEASLPQPSPSVSLFGHTKGFVPLADDIPILGIFSEEVAMAMGLGIFHFGESYIHLSPFSRAFLNLGTQKKSSFSREITLLPTPEGDTSSAFRYGLSHPFTLPLAALPWIGHPELVENPAPSQFIAQKALSTSGVKIKHLKGKLSLTGISTATSESHMIRAFYESVTYEVKECLNILEQDTGIFLKEIKVTGALANHDMLMQLQADVLQIPVIRLKQTAPEVWGAACAAGLKCGFFQGKLGMTKHQKIDKQFLPQLDPISSLAMYNEWKLL